MSEWVRAFARESGTLSLHIDEGNIRLRPSGSTPGNEDSVRIHISTNSPLEEIYDLSATESAEEVTLHVRKKMLKFWKRVRDLEISVYVPPAFSVRVNAQVGNIEADDPDYPLGNSLDLATSVGSIRVHGTRGNLRAVTGVGDVIARDVHGPAALEATVGTIVAHNSARDLQAKTSVGDIKIFGAGGQVLASGGSGLLEVCYLPGNACPGTFSMDVGRISLTLDRTIRRRIDYHVGVGSIDAQIEDGSNVADSDFQLLKVSVGTGDVSVAALP